MRTGIKSVIKNAVICVPFMLAGLVNAQTQSGRPKTVIHTVTGSYQLRQGEKRNTLEVQQLGRKRVKLHILALWVSPYNPDNVHNGEVFGNAVRKGNTAIYEDENCKLTIRFQPSGAVVDQNHATGDCDFGANVDASGFYRKLNSRKPKFDF